MDFDAELIQVARAKGDRPYSLPMVKTVRKILERRKADNATSALLSPFGGDHGFVFPSLSRDMKRVIPVAEVKERHQLTNADGRVVRDDDGEPVRVNTLPGIHVSRRTFNSVAAEIGIDLETREALMNHSGRGVNVKHYVNAERFDHLRACVSGSRLRCGNVSMGDGAHGVALVISPRARGDRVSLRSLDSVGRISSISIRFHRAPRSSFSRSTRWSFGRLLWRRSTLTW